MSQPISTAVQPHSKGKEKKGPCAVRYRAGQAASGGVVSRFADQMAE